MRKQGYTCPWNHKALSHEPSTKYKESQEEGAPKSSQRRQRNKNLPKQGNGCPEY